MFALSVLFNYIIESQVNKNLEVTPFTLFILSLIFQIFKNSLIRQDTGKN